MKLRAGRVKDDYDVSQILLHTAIDESRLSGMVSAEQLAQFLQIKGRATNEYEPGAEGAPSR